MIVFDLRRDLLRSYAAYIRSFIQIRGPIIRARVEAELDSGLLWPEALLQLNPSFEPGRTIDDLVDEGVLHPGCRQVFRIKPEPRGQGKPLRLHRHQEQAVRIAREGRDYVLTTGTGSGKSLAYIVPIVDHVLRRGAGRGIRAIVVYPMNALANSQRGELEKFLEHGFPDGRGPVCFACYTGQESDEQKRAIVADPPDVLLTNYVMLELFLTRPQERNLVHAARGLQFLVLDELHTYRGRQGSDVALLVRRVRDALHADRLQCVGLGHARRRGHRRGAAGPGRRGRVRAVRGRPAAGGRRRRDTPSGHDGVRARIRRVPGSAGPAPRGPGSHQPAALRRVHRRPAGLLGRGDLRAAGRAGRRPVGPGPPPQHHRARRGGRRAGRNRGGDGGPLRRGDPRVPPGRLPLRAQPRVRLPRVRVPAAPVHQPRRHGPRHGRAGRPAVRHGPGPAVRPGTPLPRPLAAAFCRECGQEYYTVRSTLDPATGRRAFVPRALSDLQHEDGGEAGFLHISAAEPWPDEPAAVVGRLPDDWVEEHQGPLRVRPGRRKDLPAPVRVGPDAREADEGVDAHFLPAPFRFCLHCGVSYGFRVATDFGKLATLSSEGRSTATTVQCLTAIRGLRREESLPPRARKILSFTDNRQDASLQAGHFNDFVEISLLRSALYRAVRDAGPEGLTHDHLTQKVFDALDLPVELYAFEPTVRFAAAIETKRAMRDVLGYRLYRDLRRGWRVTSPNLEQCGLLEIRYQALEEVCEAEDVWAGLHPALAGAGPSTRRDVARVLLDSMRRSLAIRVDYLDRTAQERIQLSSGQKLVPPWGLDENEALDYAAVLYPRANRGYQEDRSNVYLSPRGGFGLYLGRRTTFPHLAGALALDDRQQIIRELLEALRVAGLVEAVVRPRSADEVPGYQVPATALLWVAGDGTRAFHDPIAVPSAPEAGGRTNPFFVEFYKSVAPEIRGLEAREHTAQVPYPDRLDREERFRSGALPVLFCSPTMELGVDIAELNVVNMRNVPPTPANYAQRSGRAGRSGQPALVFTYCATGSPHDQYFFKRPELMVAGAVRPPRMDLGNEDLVRSHVHAVWLAETGQGLGTSLRDLLDLGRLPGLPLLDHVRSSLEAEAPRIRAKERAGQILASLEGELQGCDWYADGWLDEVLAQAPRRFDAACERWRGLFRAAVAQLEAQNRIIGDASRPAPDKNRARLLRREAESQIDLLTEANNLAQADFYSYRYFASEGFLPGYSFPRLPLSAYIPARRARQSRDEFVSRPRFLAITEFGPRSIVYHEGSRYQINRVILPVQEDEHLATDQAKLCPACGYLHPVPDGVGPDRCERCEAALAPALAPLFRLQNVSTKRREKINSDEEERRRLGYQVQTGVRFAEHGGRPSCRTATIEADGADGDGTEALAALTYGQAATLWRINLGENRRKNRDQFGFVLDIERGYWARSEQAGDEEDEPDPMTPRTLRVIPYVEDCRNALLLRFDTIQPPRSSPRSRRPSRRRSRSGTSLRTASWPPSRCPRGICGGRSCSTSRPRAAPACSAAWSTTPRPWAGSPARPYGSATSTPTLARTSAAARRPARTARRPATTA